ncbi:MAG TPA: hypothetical protein VH120_09870 [Gemmataceae bacterium]|nr:hypothetical protein [Gemmataceae bacterium]
MRKYLLLAGLAVGLAAPSVASARGFCQNCPDSQKKVDQYGFRKCIFGPRAAPWFLYWPYPAYFSYPAPTGAAFPPEYMSPGGFQPHQYDQQHFTPYPTNGFGQ